MSEVHGTSRSIVRIWRTRVDQSRLEDYEAFARDRSLPMFLRRDGLLGIMFAGDTGDRLVITFWRDRSAADALNSSAAYGDTVEALESTGILLSPQSVELFEVQGAWMVPDGPDSVSIFSQVSGS